MIWFFNSTIGHPDAENVYTAGRAAQQKVTNNNLVD